MKIIDKARKKWYLDNKRIVQIIGNILMILGIALVFIYKSERTFSFYWVALEVALLGSLYYLDQFGKEGKTQMRRADKKWDTKISGRAQDKMVYTMIIGVFLVCGIFALEFFFEDLSRNIWTVVYSLIVMIIYQLIIQYLSNNLYKEVAKTEESIINSNLR